MQSCILYFIIVFVLFISIVLYCIVLSADAVLYFVRFISIVLYWFEFRCRQRRRRCRDDVVGAADECRNDVVSAADDVVTMSSTDTLLIDTLPSTNNYNTASAGNTIKKKNNKKTKQYHTIQY